jgi:cytochrome c553
MKKVMILMLVVIAASAVAMAQIGDSPATDVLGAHLNYGRGCAACHAPHSGMGQRRQQVRRYFCRQFHFVGPGRR